MFCEILNKEPPKDNDIPPSETNTTALLSDRYNPKKIVASYIQRKRQKTKLPAHVAKPEKQVNSNCTFSSPAPHETSELASLSCKAEAVRTTAK